MNMKTLIAKVGVVAMMASMFVGFPPRTSFERAMDAADTTMTAKLEKTTANAATKKAMKDALAGEVRVTVSRLINLK